MRRARAGVAVFLGWTALALFFAVSSSLTYLTTGRPANWRISLERSFAEWWLWALLTPMVVALARRFPVHGSRRWRNAAMHLAFGITVALLKTMADRAIFALLTGFWTYLLASTFALQLVIYTGVVAAAHGVEYYRRSREREQLEAQLSATRLQMLNMQLQPHFLFNTLNTIAEMVHEDPEKADAMIGGLSDLLRRTLDLGSAADVTLDEELDLVQRYLDIQRTRFGDRLRVEIDASKEARAIRVPALLLQPLVENAIRHGLGARLDAGRISIDAVAASDSITITITDDGEGNGGGAEGIGLGNTRARLQTAYGNRARLELSPAPGRGTRVKIVVPR